MGFNPLQLVIDAYKKVTLPWLNNTPIVSPFLYTMTLMQKTHFGITQLSHL